LAIALAGALVLLGVQSWRLAGEQRDHAQTRGDHAVLMAHAAKAAQDAEVAARLEEQRRVAALEGVIHETESKLAQARADADLAADAGQRLRQRIAQLAGSCRGTTGDPTAAGAGSATSATDDLLADVQRRLDEAADQLARFADASHTAGLACQQSYGALSQSRFRNP
jgi:hypothetical protein